MSDTKPLALTDDEIESLGHRMCWRYKHSNDPNHSSMYTFNRTKLIDFAHAIIEKCRTKQTPDPTSVIMMCKKALAEELTAWDIDPPIHHIKEAHDACEAWLTVASTTKEDK